MVAHPINKGVLLICETHVICYSYDHIKGRGFFSQPAIMPVITLSSGERWLEHLQQSSREPRRWQRRPPRLFNEGLSR